MRSSRIPRMVLSGIPKSIRYKSTSSKIDIEELLSQPHWSISNLLPNQENQSNVSETMISREKLHHLLRLSALEPPSTPEAESKMLKILSDQLYFVRAVQSVDTTGIKPLSALRDETRAGELEEEERIMAKCEEVLKNEQIIGKYFRRVQIRPDDVASHPDVRDEEVPKDWNAVDAATKKSGRFFLVEK